MSDEKLSVLVLYNLHGEEQLDAKRLESEDSVMVEVKVVAAALEKLEIPYRVVGLRRIEDLYEILSKSRETIVFNIVEGLPYHNIEANYVPAICTAFGKAVTGCDAACLSLCVNKWKTKAVLQASGIMVPDGIIVPPGASFAPLKDLTRGPYIVKPCLRDASEGMEGKCVFDKNCKEMQDAIKKQHAMFNEPVLVERFVGSREFNLSIVQNGQKVDVMPIAEIDFSAFPPEMPKIIDYAAKWKPETFGYNNTNRVIPAKVSDTLARRIRSVAVQSWKMLGCRDFVRVDMRVDEKEQVYVLEVNPNPDISPDAGFAAALTAAGIPFEKFVERIIKNADLRYKDRRSAAMTFQQKTILDLDYKMRVTQADDRPQVLDILNRTGYFRPDEVAVAMEVLDEGIAKGPSGHYQSYVAELDGKAIGWICFGPTPCAIGTYDIYWIVVDPTYQGMGIGKSMLIFAEDLILKAGGRLSIIDTSGKNIYESTRMFYSRMGYAEEARITDFYQKGDDKVVYVKRLQ